MSARSNNCFNFLWKTQTFNLNSITEGLVNLIALYLTKLFVSYYFNIIQTNKTNLQN